MTRTRPYTVQHKSKQKQQKFFVIFQVTLILSYILLFIMDGPIDENALENQKKKINVNGIGRLIPALHSEWILPREWISYIPPPNPDSELYLPGAKETWIERINLVIDDLKTILRCPYHVFWSQIKFDRDLHKTMSQLLKRLPRVHDKYAVYPDQEIQGSGSEESVLQELLSGLFSFFI